MAMRAKGDAPGAFWRIATAGVFFQGGAAAVDTGTIVAALVHGLTGSPLAVGAAAAISRCGWLLPQLFVAHAAQGLSRRMPLYMLGAFGRAGCLLALGAFLWLGENARLTPTVAIFFVLWTLYAFVGGIVAVPYNDIVARAIPSDRRSRLLALRFFGGGLLALLVAVVANRALERLAFPDGYAAVLMFGAILLLLSAVSFVSAGEPPAGHSRLRTSFRRFLVAGVDVLKGDRRFRSFLGAQWLGGAVSMALPFYVLQAKGAAILEQDVAVLIAAQTAGALISNPFCGWWGDQRGKLSLLRLTAAAGTLAPGLTLLWLAFGTPGRLQALVWFALVFAVLGAVENGRTIAQLGYLMEISPDDRRPAYSGYFNVLAAPASLLPIAAAALAEVASFATLFAISLIAALMQMRLLYRLPLDEGRGAT